MNVNKAQIVGRMTRDPELRSTPSGAAVCTFSLATNYTYTDKAGQKVENVSFHNCTMFGKGAEVFAQYAVKGQEIYIDGRIDYQSWTKKDGSQGEKTVIMVENFQFGQRPKGYVAPSEGSQGAHQDDIPSINLDDQEEDVKMEDVF